MAKCPKLLVLLKIQPQLDVYPKGQKDGSQLKTRDKKQKYQRIHGITFVIIWKRKIHQVSYLAAPERHVTSKPSLFIHLPFLSSSSTKPPSLQYVSEVQSQISKEHKLI